MKYTLKHNSHLIYFLLLVFIAVSLPLSMYTLSLSMILLTINWISYENIVENKYGLSNLDLTNLSNEEWEFFHKKLNAITSRYRSYLS